MSHRSFSLVSLMSHRSSPFSSVSPLTLQIELQAEICPFLVFFAPTRSTANVNRWRMKEEKQDEKKHSIWLGTLYTEELIMRWNDLAGLFCVLWVWRVCVWENKVIFRPLWTTFKVFLSFLCASLIRAPAQSLIWVGRPLKRVRGRVAGKVRHPLGRLVGLSYFSNLPENKWRRAAEAREEGKWAVNLTKKNERKEKSKRTRI